MPRPVREPDIVDQIRRMQEEIRLLRLKDGTVVHFYDLIPILNPAWIPVQWSPESTPDFESSGHSVFGAYRDGATTYWEGGLTYAGGGTEDPKNLLHDIPEDLRPANFTVITAAPDITNSAEYLFANIHFTTDGFVGFSSFLKPDGTTIEEPEGDPGDFYTQFYGISYRAAPAKVIASEPGGEEE